MSYQHMYYVYALCENNAFRSAIKGCIDMQVYITSHPGVAGHVTPSLCMFRYPIFSLQGQDGGRLFVVLEILMLVLLILTTSDLLLHCSSYPCVKGYVKQFSNFRAGFCDLDMTSGWEALPALTLHNSHLRWRLHHATSSVTAAGYAVIVYLIFLLCCWYAETITVHAPQPPSPHPSFVPVRPTG